MKRPPAHGWRPFGLVKATLFSSGEQDSNLRPLGYELTGRRLQSPLGSQTCRSRLLYRPSHHVTFHAISAVAPRFVPKSVPNLAEIGLSSELVIRRGVTDRQLGSPRPSGPRRRARVDRRRWCRHALITRSEAVGRRPPITRVTRRNGS